jgi:hypothetical protein
MSENSRYRREAIVLGDAGSVDVVSIDMPFLVVELGAADDGEDLARRAMEVATNYASTTASAVDWLLGRTEFPVVDLLTAFSHGCRHARDTGSLLYQESALSSELGYHKIRYGSQQTFALVVSEAVRVAATSSVEADVAVRYLLYNDDWMHYFCSSLPCARNIVAVLDLRTLDFFLPDPGSLGWDKNWSVDSLFAQVAELVFALRLVGRENESTRLGMEIEARRCVGLTLVDADSSGEKPGVYARLFAERTWVEYIGAAVWERVQTASRADLIDAHVGSIAVHAGYYRTWRHVLQALLQVVERELNTTILALLRHGYSEMTDFIPTGSRALSRQRTFDAVSRALRTGKALTLGELGFVLSFWDDPIMDQCTTLFSKARCFLAAYSPGAVTEVGLLHADFSHMISAETRSYDIVSLRNACAHPGHEKELTHPGTYHSLRELVGEPPRRLLQRIVVNLRGATARAPGTPYC